MLTMLQIYWSGTGSLVAITSEESFYVLRFDRDAYNAKLEEGVEVTDEGVEEAFDVVSEVSDKQVWFPTISRIVHLTPLAAPRLQNGSGTVSSIPLRATESTTLSATSLIPLAHQTCTLCWIYSLLC